MMKTQSLADNAQRVTNDEGLVTQTKHSENESALRGASLRRSEKEEGVKGPEEEAPSRRCIETRVREDLPYKRSIETEISPSLQHEHHALSTASPAASSQGKLRDLKRLYGRSHQEEILAQAYENAMQNGGANLVVINGGVGMGKTAIAQSLAQKDGFFITWKFDHESQLEVGDGFTDAFTSLRDQIMASGDDGDVSHSVREGIRGLGPVDCAILLGYIPMFVPMVGEAEVDIDPFGVEASGRSLGIFKRMMRTVCNRERPLVVLFDDVQFSDRCSHILMNELVRDADNDGILYVFTVGPEEPTAPIDEMIASFENAVNITTIELAPLDEDTTNQIVADSLKVELEDSAPMASFLYYHTKGNPLLVKEMLRLMVDNRVLVFDEVAKTWHCNEERMDCVYQCKDFGTMVRGKLIRSSEATKKILKVAACLGTKIDVSLLDVAVSRPVVPELSKAIASGLVIAVDVGHYRFSNNGIQQAVYASIPDGDREAFNLSVGRRLLHGLTDEKIVENLSLILRLFKRGEKSISSQSDRFAIAALCLKEGEKAATEWSSFGVAAESLDFGISLLDDRCWRDKYDLALSTYIAACEVAYTTGSHEKVHQLANIVLSNARTIDHKLPVYCTKINSLAVSSNIQEAIDLGLAVLRQIGEPVQSNPSTPTVLIEYARMRRFMRNMPREKVRRLPNMTDHRKAAVMQIINLVAIPALFGRPMLMPLLTFKAVQITVAHGLCAISAVAFGLYGMVLAGYAGKYDEAGQLAELSLELLERFATRQWLPRVHAIAYGSIFAWRKDLTALIEPLQRGYDAGIETGDFEYALYNVNMKCGFMFCTGTPLPLMKTEMDEFIEVFTKLKQGSTFVLLKGLLLMVEALMEADSSDVFDRFARSVKKISTSEQADVRDHSWFLFKLMAMAYLVGDYARAVAEADNIESSKGPIASSIDVSMIVMFDALSRISECKQNGRSKKRTLVIARKRITKLKKYAKANPRFCLGMLSLVEAEVAVLRGNHDIATQKYFSSVSMFNQRKMLLQHGMASELAGKYMLDCGQQDVAKDYLIESRRSFEEWGAKGKCDVLTMEIEELYGKSWC